MPTLQEIDQEILSIKNQILLIGQQKEKILRESKLKHFVPSRKQMEFIQRATTKRRGGFCGNRFGKSTIGVVEDCSWLLGERPYFPMNHVLRRAGIPFHGVKGLVIGEDWDKVQEIFTEDNNPERPGKFFEYLPPDCIFHKTRNPNGVICGLTIKNKIDGRIRTSTVTFETVRSYMSNPKSLESSDWDFIHVDEPLPKPMWKAVSRGLIDRGGFAWWLLTAMTEPWMYQEMVKNAKKYPNLYWFFEASMDDNPLLSEEDKELYLGQLTEEEKECRRDGKPLALGRLVFGHYSEDKHLWKKPEPPHGWVNWTTPPKEYMCAYALDVHSQTAQAVLFIAIAPSGEVFLYDEIFRKMLLDPLALLIKHKMKGNHFEYQLCDPLAWVKNPDTGKRWVDSLWDRDLELQQGSKEKTAGILEANNLLGSDRKIWVFPHLRTFRDEILTWYFDKDNKPKDENDHMMENFRRLVQHDQLQFHAHEVKPKRLKSHDPFEQTTFDLQTAENPYSI